MHLRRMASSGWTRITSSFRSSFLPSYKPPEMGLNWTRMSTSFSSRAFPATSTKGTPAHRALFTYITAMAYVGVMEPSGTVRSSRYPTCPRAGLAWYCPITRSESLRGVIDRRTSTLRLRTSSALDVIGGSIATSASSWRRWFCMTSRTIPYSSKYPPRPIVPMSSLNEIRTHATWERFQRGSKTRLEKRSVISDCAISLPR
mmetsp:Transcript_55345/g.131448  ORF Transcript_55345/g.131448 Transcript_55345/m.131448 type:complete len:202 (-) Transcript_55345:135-740(-)